MKTLHRMVFREFIPIFIFSLLFFILILQLVDIFANLWRYLNNDVPLLQIGQVAYHYLPKCVSYSLPISLLFSISYTLGQFYSRNELIMVFGSGISLYHFILPFIAAGIILSAFSFYFEEYAVISNFNKKEELTRQLLNQKETFSNTNVTVLSNDAKIVYHAEYYNDSTKTLSQLVLIERNGNGTIKRRINAEYANWKQNQWVLHNCTVYSYKKDSKDFLMSKEDQIQSENYSDKPTTFQKDSRDIEKMQTQAAKEWIDSLKNSGLPYKQKLTDYYRRFAFALTPLVVALLSSAIGGRFRKNILLMSLLTSLVLSVIYYVSQMVTSILAKLHYLQPMLGAWLPVIVFGFAGIILLRHAKT